MKRVLAVLLCLLLVCGMLALVACDRNGEDDTDTDGSGSTPDGHVHTYKTDAEWTKDASGHWYDVTCGCVNATVRKLQHVDDNKDAICDVCKFEYDHEHTYSEDWTVDCTNHWNAADCGCIIPAVNVEAHVDENGDGECDTCKYVIEDLHNHYYDTKWSNDAEYHWHAALCEHNAELADRAAHEINAAGNCTVCGAKVKDVDKTSIYDILAAAVANNKYVISGTVFAKEEVFGSSNNLEAGKTNEVFYLLGDSDSYVKWGSYDKNGNFIGIDEAWYETLDDETIFAVQIPYYHLNTGDRNNQLVMFPVDGNPDKLNGYNYTPGAILAAGYDDNTTIAQTLANLYDILEKGENVSNVVENYDAETGMYTFSYTYFFVTENKGNTAQDGSGDEIITYTVELFNVSAEFKVTENFVIYLANFSVESFRNLTGVDEDISYDPETNTVTMLSGASPTRYTYNVTQSEGVRTYTTIYPKAALMPVDFELGLVTGTDYNDGGQMYVTSEEPLVDTDGDGLVDIVLPVETFTRLHIGSIIPASAIASFMDINDFEVIAEPLDGSAGLPWGTAMFQSPTYSGYMDCIQFRTSSTAGKYLITIRFGLVEKKIVITIPGVVAPDMSGDNEFGYHVQTTDNNTYADEYTYTATESGTYTFNLPAGLGWSSHVDYYVAPGVHYENNTNGATVTVELAAGQSVTYYVGATVKDYFFITVDFVAGEVEVPDEPENPGDSEPIDITGTYEGNGVTVVIDETTVSFTKGSNTLVCTYSIDNGEVTLYNASGAAWSSSMIAITLTSGKVTGGVYNGNSITLTKKEETPVEPEPPVEEVIDITGTYEGNGVTVVIDETTVSFTKNSNTLVCTYSISNGEVTLYNASGAAWSSSMIAITLTDGKVTGGVYNGSSITLAKKEDSGDTPVVPDPEPPQPETDPLKDTLHLFMPNNGTYNFMFLSTNGEYVVNIYGTGFDMFFTYELEDNGDDSYNMTVSYVEREGFIYNAEYAEAIEAEVFVLYYDGAAWSMQQTGSGDEGGDETDSLKDAVLGYYTINGVDVIIYKNYDTGVYTANIYGDDYDLYFTFEVTDNYDGSYTLALEYLESENERGTEYVDAVIAQEWIVTPETDDGGDDEDMTIEEILAAGIFEGVLNGDSVMFYTDGETGYFMVNIWGTGFDVYYIGTITDNYDGTYSISLAAPTEGHWAYDAEADYSHADKIIIAAVEGNTATVYYEGEAPEAPEGSDENPIEITEGDYTTNFPGGYTPIWYVYTATANGYVTVSTEYANPWFQIGTSLDFVTANRDEMDNVLNSVTIYVLAGQTVYISVGDFDFVEADVEFSVAFEAFESESIDNLVGTWTGTETNMWGGSVSYTFTINADGTGTGLSDMGYWVDEYEITFILVDGNTVTIYAVTTGEWGGSQYQFVFEYDSETKTLVGATFTLATEGSTVVEPEPEEPAGTVGTGTQNDPFIIESIPTTLTQGAGHDVYYKYTVTEDATIVISYPAGCYIDATGGTKDSFARTYTYEAKAGDVISFNVYTSGVLEEYVYTVTVKGPDDGLEGAGTSTNPYVIVTLPFDMTHKGNEEEKYYTYTATEKITLTITCPTGCFVSGTGVSKNDQGNYVVTLEAGQSITFNPWANTADKSASTTHTYSITGEVVVEEPGQGEGEATGAVTYVGSNGSRGMKIVIDVAADTMVITRAQSGSLTNFDGGTSYTFSYSATLALANANNGTIAGTVMDANGSTTAIMNMVFDANGVVTSLAWNGSNYTNYEKQ